MSEQLEHKPELLLHPPGHPDRCWSLNILAVDLWTQFRQSGQLLFLDRAIEYSEEALVLCPSSHPDRAEPLNNIALALLDRFKQSGQLIDLNRAIEHNEEALPLCPPPHPDRSSSLNNLANALRTLFKQSGELIDLNRAIQHSEEALALCPPPHLDRAESLNNLGLALSERFGQLGQLIDLDRAIELHEEALLLLPHLNRARFLNNLTIALGKRFEQSGHLIDLNRAIEHAQEAVVLFPPGHRHRPSSLSNLASALYTRFEQSGQLLDLDRAIEHYQEALVPLPLDNPYRSLVLNNVTDTLWARFLRSGQLIDLDRAIEHSEEALVLRPPGNPYRAESLHTLANTLWARFGQGGQLIDLDRAIERHEEALVLHPPGHPHRADCLNYFALALQTLFVQSGKLTHLDKAIEYNEEALVLRPPGHPHRSQSLDNLASTLQTRFGQSGTSLDLDDAISYCSQALQCTPDSLRVGIHVRLGDLHRSGSRPNFDLALAEYSRGARFEFGIPSDRFTAAIRWIKYSTLSDPSPPLDGSSAYTVAIDLLPQLFWLGIDPASRLQALRRAPELGCDAAAWAVRSGEFSHAVELLEQGRAIFWAHTLHIQNPFDDLPDDLGTRLRKLSRQLQAGTVSSQASASMSASETYRRRKLQTDWTDTIEHVRTLAGFEHFLRTPPFSQLLEAAKNGPVVMLIGSVHGCSALVIEQGYKTPQHVSFSISYHDVKNLNERLSRVLKLLGVGRVRHARKSKVTANGEDEMSQILAVLWDEVVEPVIDHLKLTPSENPPRLWWCPTGPFSFLPLHAATKNDRTAAHFVISSYTPTLDALIVAQSAATVIADPKVVVVIQPDVKGLPLLHQTIEESRRIAAAVPSEFMLNVDGTRKYNQEPENPEVGTVQNVLDRLGEASIVHLACHGKQDSMMPLESALFLHDGELTISRMQSVHRKLPASLAFLSACESAMGDEGQPDEVIHLAAAMLSAGFQSTVGTMWPIADVDGPVVAEVFYNELFKDRSLDSSRTAHALHAAVTRLRNMKVSSSRWVPFIHVGL